MTLAWILAAIGLLAFSGVTALGMPRGSALGDRWFAAMMTAGGLMGFTATILALLNGNQSSPLIAWSLPWGRIALHVDTISAAFLLPIFAIPAFGAIFGCGYWPVRSNPRSAGRLRVFYGILAASMALVVLARDGVFFLVAWEAMALSAFFCVAAEDDKPEVRQAAWVYFVAAHVGSLALLALFALMRSATGTFDLTPLAHGAVPAPMADAMFVLALIGFGLKAGVMPLHIWLPGAHANAPSHVSAVLSGVMLNVGLYGLLRVVLLLPENPAWWGWLLLGVGAASAILGIAYSLAQHDVKRLLAYSSIENMGIILMALGAALLGRALGDLTLTAIALAGGILHLWNHSLFKSMLFMVAGAVLHATGTRRMNDLGGLARLMPRTAAVAAVGCVAICALPPLNGFVSEWLIYRGLLQGAASSDGLLSTGTALGMAALALTGALAIAAFTKFFAITFLGQARSNATAHAHDPPLTMIVPMVLLGAASIVIGLVPGIVGPILIPVVRMAVGGAAADQLRTDHLHLASIIGACSLSVLVLSVGAASALRRLARRPRPHPAPRPNTWDCGYLRPTARMQYSDTSLVQMLIGLFAWALVPQRRSPRFDTVFPDPASHDVRVPDVVLDRAVIPGLRLLARLAMGMRLLQQGRTQVYVLYILLAVLILILLI